MSKKIGACVPRPLRRITSPVSAYSFLLLTSACTVNSSIPGPALTAGARHAFATRVTDAVVACDALSGLVIPSSQIGEPTTGAIVTSATFRVAQPERPDPAGRAMISATPDYCEVKLDILPVDPDAPMIKSQVNLPSSWNGKKLQFGGSGYNGVLQTGVQPSRNAGPDVPLPLTQGYMTVGTDSGHQLVRGSAGGEASGDDPRALQDQNAWALNDEALTNYAYAAYKKTHDAAVAIGRHYYGRSPDLSYYMGGSEGGREGLTMAQRYPQDYDGIIVIDPVMNFSGLQTFGNYLGGISQSRPGAWTGPKWQLLADTVIATCDRLDGIADKISSDYRRCNAIALAAVEAKRCPTGADEGPSCFSDAQLHVIRTAYSGFHFDFPLANNMQHYAGFGFGSEGMARNWPASIAGQRPPNNPHAEGSPSRMLELGSMYVRYFVARDPDFDTLTYDPNQFRERVEALSRILDATDPDLSAFYRRGGRLILRADLGDMGQSPYSGLDYHDAVSERMGRSIVDRFFAAFVAPGLPHTSGGVEGGEQYAPSHGVPGRVDLLEVLEKWVEEGIAPPGHLTMTNQRPLPPYEVTASKPMCRYGFWPRYIGTNPGGAALAENYACIAYQD